jgi:hypothetical protein
MFNVRVLALSSAFFYMQQLALKYIDPVEGSNPTEARAGVLSAMLYVFNIFTSVYIICLLLLKY